MGSKEVGGSLDMTEADWLHLELLYFIGWYMVPGIVAGVIAFWPL